MTDEARVTEIVAWFSQHGYELVIHPVKHGGFFAPWMPSDSRGGTAAPFAWGKTAIEAAEAARAEFERELPDTDGQERDA